MEFEEAIGLAPEHDTCVNIPDSTIMEQLININYRDSNTKFDSSVTPYYDL